MLLFLSSAARLQYAEDILRIMALPKGTWLRFRYDLSLVEGYQEHGDNSGLVERLLGGKLNCAQDGIVCFLDSIEKRKPVSLVPCRYCKATLEVFDPILVCHLRVGEFCSIEPEVFTDSVSKSTSGLLPQWTEDGGETVLTGSWVFEAEFDDDFLASGSGFKEFAKVCDSLSTRYPFFAGAEGDSTTTNEDSLNPFWHVAVFAGDVKSKARRSVKGLGLNDGLWPRNGDFVLEGGKAHTLRVFHYYPAKGKRKKDFARNLNVQIQGVEESKNFNLRHTIKSEYDVKDIGFKTVLSPFKHKGLARLSISELSKDSEREFSDIEIPIEIEPNFIHTVLNVVLFGQGFIIPALIAASFRDGFSLWSSQAAFIVLAGLIAGGAAVFGLRRSV